MTKRGGRIIGYPYIVPTFLDSEICEKEFLSPVLSSVPGEIVKQIREDEND